MATVVAALRCIVYFTVVGIFATERSRPGVFRAMLKTVIESCCPWSFVPLVVRFLSKTFHAQGNFFRMRVSRRNVKLDCHRIRTVARDLPNKMTSVGVLTRVRRKHYGEASSCE